MTEPEYVEVLLPGFIEANNAVQFGEPCITGTRIPYYVGLAWVWDYLDKPEKVRPDLTREHIIALAAFHAGYEWHKQRGRRKRMAEAVRELWANIAAATEREGSP